VYVRRIDSSTLVFSLSGYVRGHGYQVIWGKLH
jgi:hypothetical protein